MLEELIYLWHMWQLNTTKQYFHIKYQVVNAHHLSLNCFDIAEHCDLELISQLSD